MYTSRHQDAASYQKLLVMAAEDTKEPQNNTSPAHNTKADGETAETDAERVMSVDVERLRWPEHNK